MGKRGLQPLGSASPIDTTKELLAQQHRAKTVDAGSRRGRGEKRKKEKEVTLILLVRSLLCEAFTAKKSAIERRCRGPKCWEANKQAQRPLQGAWDPCKHRNQSASQILGEAAISN